MNNILQGDCINRLKELDDNSVDAIVTDPPYELGFMGKKWDASGISYNVELWKECLRVLKAGGHLLSFGGTRTYHRMACAIEDAGFEIRDMLEWIYATGFPKSHNIGKAVDKLQGNERDIIGQKKTGADKPTGKGTLQLSKKTYKNNKGESVFNVSKGTSEWEGWGTALKPAHEPIVLARKPLSEKTIAENVLKWGTGGINIDGCRVGMSEKDREDYIEKRMSFVGTENKDYSEKFTSYGMPEVSNKEKIKRSSQGRFPANLLVTDDALGEEKSRYFDIDVWGEKHGLIQTPKASKKERNAGCEKLDKKRRAGLAGSDRDGNLDDVSERWR
ncbi:MAG: DNA methyltransferase, partial [Nitrospinota bacterium]|nr:DNA methyltransferase [Nitrospinota bacterium]